MSKLEWTLAGLIGLLFVLVAAMLLLVWGIRAQSAIPAPPPVAARTVETAHQAYDIALPVARKFAPDALLLSIRGIWPQGEFQAENGDWTFLFYAPENQKTALITVSGETARLVSSTPSPAPLQPPGDDFWRVDSPAAIEAAMAEGGAEFVAVHPEATMMMTLDASRVMRWLVRLTDTEQSTTLKWRINAVSGMVSRMGENNESD